MSTNGKRNKNAGHSWEREVVTALKALGYEHLVTTRSESRGRDAQKIDLMNKDELKNGRFPFNIQCKTTAKPLSYPKVLSEMPQNSGYINIIAHKQTQKSDSGRFLTRGQYIVFELAGFYAMLKRQRQVEDGIKLLMNYFDYIPEEEKDEVDKKLKELGL